MTDLLALSVQQPWADAIIYGRKDIENRTRCHGRRGLTLIHASSGVTREKRLGFLSFVQDRGLAPVDAPSRADLGWGVLPGFRGGIIGAVEILDCVDSSDSPWWMGPRGYVLARPRAIPFIPCKGTVAPLFWKPPPEVLRQARASLGLSA